MGLGSTAASTALLQGVTLEPAFACAGVFGTTHDGLPFIGQVDDGPSTWFALGYGGNGITFSAIAAGMRSAEGPAACGS